MNKSRMKKMIFKCVYPIIAFIMITAAILFAFNMPRICHADKIIVQIEKIGNDGRCVVKTYADDRLISSIISRAEECKFYLVNHNKNKGK